MAKTSLDVTKYFRGNYEHQKNFIYNCRIWFQELGGIPDTNYDRRFYYETPTLYYKLYSNPGTRHLELLHVQYERGVRKGWLACSYTEYENAILGNGKRTETSWYYRPARRRHYYGYREGTKYRKNTLHKPKEGKTQRQEWRDYKGFSKDSNKHAHWHSGSRERLFYKKLQVRRRRRDDKVKLKKGEYDKIGNREPADKHLWD